MTFTTKQGTTVKKSINLVQDTEVKNDQKDPMSEILDRLKRLEEENKELKKSSFSEVIKQRKEKYAGPWMYSYKMIDGKPIVGLKTIKNDVMKNYKTGGYDINQIVELTFSNGETLKMDYDRFSQSYERSEKILVTETREKDGRKYYKFEKNGESFEVADNIIN